MMSRTAQIATILHERSAGAVSLRLAESLQVSPSVSARLLATVAAPFSDKSGSSLFSQLTDTRNPMTADHNR
jgi:hypothetical protein